MKKTFTLANCLATITIFVFGVGIDVLLEQYLYISWHEFIRYGVTCYAYGVVFVYLLYKFIWREI